MTAGGPETFNYEDLYFVELVGDGNKNPKKKWGGYSQDYDEAIPTSSETLLD